MPRTDCRMMILDTDVADQDGIAWRLESALPDPNNPLMEPTLPWDSGAVFSHGTFLRDPIDGLWKGWYISTPMDAPFFEDYRRLTYATSEDGVHWTRPELDICPYPGHAGTNILLDIDSGGRSMYPSVFVYPDAEPERRYEMFLLRFPGRPEGIGAPLVRGITPEPGTERHPFATYRYYSPDGVHWKAVEGPLLTTAIRGQRMVTPYTDPMGAADNALFYREPDGTYVAVHKIGEPMHPGGHVPYDIFPQGRRVIARRTSPNGSDWSPLEVILQPDWQDPQDLQFMELAPTPVSGGYIGVLCCYHVLTQTIDLQLAGSADGRIWHRPVRLPTLPVGPLGDYPGGMIWPTRNLIEADGRHYMYYAAVEGLHGNPSADHPTIWPFHAAICRASWQIGRYWAAVSGPGGDKVGTLTTHALPTGGRTLVVNAATSTVKEGSLQAELLNPDGTPIPGFTRDDFEEWHGDFIAQPLRWSGGATCPVEQTAVRFYIQRARLYGFAWQ